MIRIRAIVDPKDPAIKDAYALLSRTFHRAERVALREWRGSLEESAKKLLTDIAWHLLVAERDGTVVGLNSGTYFGNLNLGMIGYLAIAPTERSHGIGTRLRSRLRTLFERDALRLSKRPLDGIIGEVAESNPWLRTLARRPNVILLDFPYHQPSLMRGDQPSPFVLYLEQLHTQRSRLPVSELRRILYAIWRRGYRITRPLERPAFRAMLRALGTRRSIGSRSLTTIESP
ncbi:MAG: GNAT family N-acetyltransferase [Gemmatimonadaceae bacterium]|nr:GNAT family N-acetyltransferase [Gemmatimonadaceae bacterium]